MYKRMMRIAALIAVLAVPLLYAQDAPSIAGRWIMTVDTGAHGTRTMELSLKQTGNDVTGTFVSPHGDVPVKGQFEGRTLTLETGGEGHGAKLTFNAKLKDDDTLSGYVSSPDGDLTFSAKRASKKQ